MAGKLAVKFKRAGLPGSFVTGGAIKVICLYVLQSLKDKSFYTGITDNLEQRLKRHNNGRVKSTKSRLPFNLVHFEIFPNYESARKREKFLKSHRGRSFLKHFRARVVELADTPA